MSSDADTPRITACIASVRGPAMLPTLLAVLNQTLPPVRVIIGDCSPAGFQSADLAGWTAAQFGVEVHRLPPQANVARVRAYLLAQVTTPWTWLLDDDVFPWHTCLAALAATQARAGWGLVSSTQVDPVPVAVPWGFRSWSPNTQARPQDVQAWVLGFGSVLLRTACWGEVDTSYAPDARGGEDLLISAQIAVSHGAGVSAAARHVHLQPTGARPWLADPVDATWLRAQLEERLLDEDVRRVLAAIGAGDPATALAREGAAA